eukprot:9000934-Pyramimonas_sp.AAC.1
MALCAVKLIYVCTSPDLVPEIAIEVRRGNSNGAISGAQPAFPSNAEAEIACKHGGGCIRAWGLGGNLAHLALDGSVGESGVD